MIMSNEQLHQAQADIQTMWRFLEAARETHSPLDYQRLAICYNCKSGSRRSSSTFRGNRRFLIQPLLSAVRRVEPLSH